MRWTILRALVNKEFHRHVANRGGLALGLLLVVAAVLLSVFAPRGNPTVAGQDTSGTGGMVGGVHHCYIEYGDESPFISHLRKSVPPTLDGQIIFRGWKIDQPTGLIVYQPGIGGIHIRPGFDATGRELLQFQIWHPAGDASAMAPYEQWFWQATHQYFRQQTRPTANPAAIPPAETADDLWAVRAAFEQLREQSADKVPTIRIERQGLGGKVLDIRSAIATGMVVFALYFTCVYLLPTLNCEERERGVLLAQALSPASPFEILFAKFLFYPVSGILLAAILAGIYRPLVLNSLFFWLSLLAVATAFLGIGMTIATLARTQRAAFMGGMCYLLSVSLVLFICATNGVPFLSNIAIEYHGPRMLHAALSGDVQSMHWIHLAVALMLAGIWVTVAGRLFRRRGWQ
ncbi:MAG: ABC transporter permease [Gemmataceae bacterium]